MNHPFKSRTISVVKDLSLDEQIYLYSKTRLFKDDLLNGRDVSPYRIVNRNIGIYMVFLEDSTRTKESFKNAASFHDTRLTVMDTQHSSFNKMESYHDTFKMLSGYVGYSIFIVRSKVEGLCRWLEYSLSKYAERNHILRPGLINGGDGKHEHPTQEFLDEFTFFEHKNWRLDKIHIALIGDLFHSRTVHSKVTGLRIFHDVMVDLIAPDELGMPEHYVKEMMENGFKVRIFKSIEEYLKQNKVADIWYFTRLQLERMGEDVREKSDKLRRAVTFQKSYLDQLPEGTSFYHPLPRHRETPTIPIFIDKTPLNGWERQAVNGYYTRIIEIAMLGGALGDDFEGKPPTIPSFEDDFIEESLSTSKSKEDYKVGIKQIQGGIVIDHIGQGDPVDVVWDHIYKIRSILNLNVPSSHGVFSSEKTGKIKGIISLPSMDPRVFQESMIKKLGAIAPGCTVNFIEQREVTKKYRLHMPPRVYNFDEISCKNEFCISHPQYYEGVNPEFHRLNKNTFICKYCERPHTFKEIWDI
ncbi:MAG: aspartate carbamoyltransferase [Spirochaetales bacterium]|nr:aspartate carbamoyltransferase [Spirochaetales bacterium]